MTLRASATPAQASEPRADGVPGYDFALIEPVDALAALREGELPLCIEALNRLVFESLAHGEPRSIRAGQSWLAWGLGAWMPDLRRTQDPRRIVAGGRGICSDAVTVLADACARRGLTVEMLDLRGHIVARVREGERIRIADPDLGVVYRTPAGEIAGPEGLAEVRAALAAVGHPEPRIDAVIAAFRRTDDDALVPGNVLSPRLAGVERVLSVLDWLLPLGLIGLFVARRRARSAPAQTSA